MNAEIAPYTSAIYFDPDTNELEEKPLSMEERKTLMAHITWLNNAIPGEIIINSVVARELLNDTRITHTPTQFTSDIFEDYINTLTKQDNWWLQGVDSGYPHPNRFFHEDLYQCIKTLFPFVKSLPEDPKLMIGDKAQFLQDLEDFLAFSSLRALMCNSHYEIYNTLSFFLQHSEEVIPTSDAIESFLETINNELLPSCSNANHEILGCANKLRGIFTGLQELSAESTQTQVSASTSFISSTLYPFWAESYYR